MAVTIRNVRFGLEQKVKKSFVQTAFDNMVNKYTINAELPNELSIMVVPIEAYAEDTAGNKEIIYTATVFFDSVLDQKYLITNWHCVTGRNPKTKETIDKDCRLPSFILVYRHGAMLPQDGNIEIQPEKNFVTDIRVEYGSDSKWIMHEGGWNIDIAATPVFDDPGFHTSCVSECIGTFDPVVSIGDQVFILGFPLGIRPTGNFPIWKTGSIASEPKIMAFNEECFLIDSATRQGMSGSPVIGRLVSSKHYKNIIGRGPLTDDTLIGYTPPYSFLGVYSGRIGFKDAFEAQIGKVWYPNTVQEMLLNPKPFEHGF